MTADFLDDASNLEEAHRQHAIDAIRSIKKQPHTRCLSCNAPTEGGAAYCDKGCEEDHMLQERMKLIKGLR